MDGLQFFESKEQKPDAGEGNGVWDPGEIFDDFNDNGRWDDYVEPMEVSAYFQNTYEVPWFVADAGIRIDWVNYNSKVWADADGNFSATKPWFFKDCGRDGLCPDDYLYVAADSSAGEGDGIRQSEEEVTDNFGENMAIVIFEKSKWFYKISPRLGFSHVITDQSTFTFNYGVYHQTPIYQNIYLNTSSQEDPEKLFSETEEGAQIGNATMTAGRTQSYEFAFNVQVGRHWAYSIGGWVKKMDQLSTAKTFRSGVYEYQIASNGDYGTAKGVDLMLENKGLKVNTTI